MKTNTEKSFESKTNEVSNFVLKLGRMKLVGIIATSVTNRLREKIT